jgi:glycosyltransferase involved in cell wall biosynthesis
MLAWRDLKNPLKGGAEVVTDAYLSGLAKKGHSVVLFSAEFPGCKSKEELNGYTIIRKGGQLGVHWHGLMYAKKHEKEFDVIIDQVNTIPFFTPLLIAKKKRIAYFNQLCLNIWFYEAKFPISLIGNIFERIYLKLYWNTRMLTISESTKSDLIKHCWAKPENIFISEMQIGFKPLPRVLPKKNQFVYCGRLVSSKRADDCIRAISLIKGSRLYILGDGSIEYKKKLHELAEKLNLKNKVVFTGRIGVKERNKIMAESLAILVPSVREGWGLIVTEANGCGTTAITYDVPGLRDANKTGFVCERNNYKELAFFMNKLTKDKKLVMRKSNEALTFARTHADWEKNVDRLEKWIKTN